MKEKAKEYLTKAKELLKKVSKKVWIAIAAVLVILIVVAAVVLTLSKEEYSVLVTQVSNTEASNILTFLSEQGVTDYKVQNGNTILVPESQEDALRARLVMANLNETGNYYMENLSSFSTNEERTTAKLLDLQAKLEGTIRNFPNVIDADVYITPGENRAYVLDSNNIVNASASVSVTMVEGTMLSDEQAAAIQQLVTNAVQGLEFESVSISDKIGNIYLTGDALGGDASALKLQLQQAFENRIRTQVMNVLVPFFGEDNVRVGVMCEVELDRTTEQRTEVRLPDGSRDGRGIVSSEEKDWYLGRTGDQTAGGIVGTESNSDLIENVEALADPEAADTIVSGSVHIDYENSRSEYQIDNNGAVRMTDCSVAVSINARTAGDFDVDQIRRHVARVANIEGERDPITNVEILDDKISVVSMEFYDPDAQVESGSSGASGFVAQYPLVVVAAALGLLLFVLLLVLILVMRRKKQKKQEELEEQERREMEAMMASVGLTAEEDTLEGSMDVMELEMERGMELRKDIRQFVTDNPEIAAQMLKSWIREGESNA